MAKAKTLVGALALASIPSTLAFRNTSPLFLFSTAELLIPGADTDIAQLDDVTGRIKDVLKGCPTKSYIVMEQEGVYTDYYRDSHSTPRLSHYLSGKEEKVRSVWMVPEVIGKTSLAGGSFASPALHLSDYIKKQCGAEAVHLVKSAASDPSAETTSGFRRATKDSLQAFDAKLEDRVVDLAGSDDYTVIYTTTPPLESKSHSAPAKKPTYEMESSFDHVVQMELKRDLSFHQRANSTNDGGLFEKYQYFSPGIFMAFLAIIPLFSIIFVGLRALTSLEVSYFAFSKEMGPTAQRKQ